MNPFSIKSYQGPEYFFDRETETKRLMDALDSERNLTLFSNRRLGKTMLIQHVFHHLDKKQYKAVFIDLFATRNLSHFVRKITEVFHEQGIIRENAFFKLLGSLGASMDFDPVSGAPQLNLRMKNIPETEKSLNQLFNFLKGVKKKVVVAFDEFQEVATYEEEIAEATVRTIMQAFPEVTFIYSGSKKSLMKEMFSSSNRPFFQSTQMFELHEIDKEVYATEVIKILDRHKKKFDKDIIYKILDDTYCHTGFTQLVLSRVYSESEHIIDQASYEIVWNNILEENRSLAREQEFLLPPLQWKTLLAIAKEEFVKEPQSNKFIRKYELSTPSSVARAIKALLNKGLIIESGDMGLRLYNVFILKNLQRIPFP